MAYLSVRGVDDQAMVELKRRAAQQRSSVNSLVLEIITQGLGLAAAPRAAGTRRHDDLDALAGRWSAQDAAEFDLATAGFAEVDPALWPLQK